MRFEHDPKAKALYVSVSKKKVAQTEMLSRNFLIDKDRRGSIIGVEILGVEQVPRTKKVRVLLDISKVPA